MEPGGLVIVATQAFAPSVVVWIEEPEPPVAGGVELEYGRLTAG